MFAVILLLSFTISVKKSDKFGKNVKSIDKKGEISHLLKSEKGLKEKNGIRAKEYDQGDCSDAYDKVQDVKNGDASGLNTALTTFYLLCTEAPWYKECEKYISNFTTQGNYGTPDYVVNYQKVLKDNCNPNFGLFGIRVNSIFAVISLVLASFWLFQ
jgi:hypothetical protein